MRFETQHVRVQGKNSYSLHRSGRVTWKTSGEGSNVRTFEVTEHATTKEAKMLFGNITMNKKSRSGK